MTHPRNRKGPSPAPADDQLFHFDTNQSAGDGLRIDGGHPASRMVCDNSPPAQISYEVTSSRFLMITRPNPFGWMNGKLEYIKKIAFSRPFRTWGCKSKSEWINLARAGGTPFHRRPNSKDRGREFSWEVWEGPEESKIEKRRRHFCPASTLAILFISFFKNFLLHIRPVDQAKPRRSIVLGSGMAVRKSCVCYTLFSTRECSFLFQWFRTGQSPS